MTVYNVVADSNGDSTVVTEYKPQQKSTSYQSEDDLEKQMIELLESQGYEHLPLHTEQELINNLRKSLEELNDYSFTDAEWGRFFKSSIASASDGIVEKTRRIQRDHVQPLKRDDGTTHNIRLIDKQDIHRNKLQVIRQYVQTGDKGVNRYDVTILVNGLPLIHIELKRRGVSIKEAFNQIKRYSTDSFGTASGLFEYVQIFIISNGTFTKYYANTTRDLKVKQSGGAAMRSGSAFEFTSYWADAKNQVIPDLMDFTRTFLARHTVLNILIRYCVFTEQEMLLVMRPYQIVATERIISRICMTSELKKTGSIEAGGYIWHTTGSGKTLTSFKTAQLASQLPDIDKVLFVVDRKDLDVQTIREYDRFQKGAANGNTSTRLLQKQLEDPEARIIVTTIQKLDRFVTANKSHPVYGKHVAIIFDECHRSQFGEMHASITKAFKKYHLFGFTGTPIFAANAGSTPGGTTEQTFGKQLHSYTVVDAINDGNVLPWHIDYVSTMHSADKGDDAQVAAIDTQGALQAPARIRGIVKFTLDHYRQKTCAQHAYTRDGKRLRGFNSIFAAQSISMAKAYYDEFRRQIGERTDDLRRLKIATIFSFNPNETADDTILPDESFSLDGLDESSKQFLDRAIADYNAMYGTNFSSSGESFERYYRDLSLRLKNRELDLLIVVNMFLTGFDAPTLNTLWVDKNLKQHGLIQAFSRTNRILNSIKKFGNIVSFRNLEKETEEALALFGNKDAAGIVLLKNFDAYFNGYEENGKHHEGYTELLRELTDNFEPGEVITGEKRQKDFVSLFGKLLRLRNILVSFSEFEDKDPLPPGTLQNYQAMYIDLYQTPRPSSSVGESIQDDIVFEMELIRHLEVTIDYILDLVQKYSDTNCTDKSILTEIRRAVDSSLELRSKKALIEQFLSHVDPGNGNVAEAWRHFVEAEREKEIQDLIQNDELNEEELRLLLQSALETGSLQLMGRWFDEISRRKVSRFGGARKRRKQELEEKLIRFVERYADTL